MHDYVLYKKKIKMQRTDEEIKIYQLNIATVKNIYIIISIQPISILPLQFLPTERNIVFSFEESNLEHLSSRE